MTHSLLCVQIIVGGEHDQATYILHPIWGYETRPIQSNLKTLEATGDFSPQGGTGWTNNTLSHLQSTQSVQDALTSVATSEPF